MSDLIEGLVRLMNSDYTQPCNLGNPDEYSIKEFATTVQEMTNSKSTIMYLPKVTDDPTQRQADITTAKRELAGWTPQVHVKDGLSKTIDFFTSMLECEGEIEPTGPEAAKPKGK